MTVNLRAAEIDNYWRRLKRRDYPTSLRAVSFKNLRPLKDASIGFESGITAIIGANGVGKSTVAAAITDLVAGVQSESQYIRVAGSRLSGTGTYKGGDAQFESADDLDPAAHVIELVDTEFGWIDSNFSSRIVNLIHDDENFDELLEGVSPSTFSPDKLRQISYLVNKIYDECLVYEIEDTRRDFPVFPYFKVRCGNVSYATESMGSGELSLLVHFWMLDRLSKNSILVLEEPETFISPRSQLALMNLLAKFSSDKGIWTIVVTHSPTILKRIPLGDVRLLTQGGGTSVFTSKTTRKQIEELLGEGSTYRACVLVEDDGARTFLQGVLENLAPELLSSVEILPAGDESSIRSVVEAFPKAGAWLQILGVFDGNFRSKHTELATNWPVFYLPGDGDPDALLQACAGVDAIQRVLADRLGRTADEIVVACNGLIGENYHDWPIRLSKFLEIDIHTLRKHLVSLWLESEDHLAQANKLISDLRRSLIA